MISNKIPLPPKGYQFLATFQYPGAIWYIARSLTVLTGVGLYQLAAWGIVGGSVFRDGIDLGISLLALALILSIDVIREILQRGISRWLGYTSSYGIVFLSMWEGTFAVDPGQFYPRRDALWIAIIPICLFLLPGLPLLFRPPEIIGDVLAYIVIVCLSDTVMDIYFMLWLLSKPRKTILYSQSIHKLLVFEPS
ncbi:MAG: hypothetical protein WCD86_01290 [Ktedonobacteraceae bacterium]